ncbi:MAG: hypothetical protein GX958_02365 [Desulfitobacterium sp.]|nr:hypothetical protein [Desulfitobacterium sp.]
MDLEQTPFQSSTLQGSSPEVLSQFDLAKVAGINEGVIINEVLAEELEVALPDISHFHKRLSNIIGIDAVVSLERNLPELMGYSRECADCMAENSLLGNMPRESTMQ